MSETIFLSQPALVSALGEGAQQHINALLGERDNYMSLSADWIERKSLLFAAFTDELRPFPTDLPDGLRSRNNQLLWHAVAQIEAQVQQVLERYGANRVAVVMGTSTSGNDENLAAFEYANQHHDWTQSGFSQAKQSLSSPADFIAYQYGLKNLSYSVSTACTSGARALISAAKLLQLGLCDAVICGGVDTLSKLTINGFDALEVLSPGQCQPFAQERDGINIGEAAAVFIATREKLEGNQSTMALYGWGGSSDAYHMSSPRPDAAGAITAITSALTQAKCAAQNLLWVNLHGTGTAQNDAMEAKAIASICGQTVSCASTKSLTGHTLGAAGALEAAFLCVVLSREFNPQGYLPKHRMQGTYDPELAVIHLTAPAEQCSPSAKRMGMSTSFAFGGNNVALVIGEVE